MPRWENIKMSLQKTEYEGSGWIQLALVAMEVNIQIP
jgi:hypothetical protein